MFVQPNGDSYASNGDAGVSSTVRTVLVWVYDVYDAYVYYSFVLFIVNNHELYTVLICIGYRPY